MLAINPMSPIAQTIQMIDDLSITLADLPDEQKARIEADLQKIRACVTGLTLTTTDDQPIHREEALRASEARERARANELAALMDAVPAMIWISHDAQASDVIGNQFGNEFLRMGPGANLSESAPQEVLQQQPYQSLKNGHVIPPNELPIQTASATGKPARNYDFDLVFNDGTIYHLLGNVNPLFDSEGKPAGAVGAFVDISELRRLQEERIGAMAEMEVQRRLMEQREQERIVIARDLHDGPIQTLSSTIFHLHIIREAFPDPALHIELSQISIDIKNTIRELREVLNDLRPPAVLHFGLSKVIQMHIQDIRERHPGIEIEMDVMDDERRLSDQAYLALFRIYQAGINNILRHSDATRVQVVYKVSQDSFLLELRDNGKGFEVSQNYSKLTRAGHFGLVGMKERAEAIGGEFTVSSTPGQGTIIQVKGPFLGVNLR